MKKLSYIRELRREADACDESYDRRKSEGFPGTAAFMRGMAVAYRRVAATLEQERAEKKSALRNEPPHHTIIFRETQPLARADNVAAGRALVAAGLWLMENPTVNVTKVKLRDIEEPHDGADITTPEERILTMIFDSDWGAEVEIEYGDDGQ